MPHCHLPAGRHPLKRPRGQRPGLESLEDRTLLTVASPLQFDGLSLASTYDKDHILVRFQSGQAAVPLAGTTLAAPVSGLPGLYKVQLGSGMSVAQAVSAYRKDPRVQLAEPDYHLATSALSTAISTDTRLADQWALRNTGQGGGLAGADLDIANAWRTTTGSSRMVVSVMDTGVDYKHPDLYQNVWLNQGEIPASRRSKLIDTNSDGLITFRDLNDWRNKGDGKITDLNRNGFIDAGDLLAPMVKDSRGIDTGKGGWADRISNDRDSYVDDLCGWNFVSNSNNVMDDFGHGTHVAGILGAAGNNGVGVSGINWNVQMMPIKFMSGTGAGSISDFIEGLDYAVKHGAKISNNSWTGATYSTALLGAIESARVRGHVFVAAAGNFDSDNDRVATYPAGFKVDNVVSVTATDRYDRLASFANYGARSVTLAAPGVDILSTTLGGGYGYNSGTSMATPHVAGVMALVWSANPGWTYGQVIRKVTGSVDKVSALTGKTTTGGRVNAATAVRPTTPVATPAAVAPRIVQATWSGPVANTLSKVRVTFDRAMSLSSFNTWDVRLTNPRGQVIGIVSVRVVSGTGDRTFDVTFAKQTLAGNYSMRIGPEVTDLRGTKIVQWFGTSTIRATTPPPVVTAATWSGPAANSLAKVRVTFDRAMTLSSFNTWDVRLTNPRGQVIAITSVKVVPGTGDRTFEVNFAGQTLAGNYSMRIGPEVTDLRGTKMVQWFGTSTIRATTPTPAVTRTYTSTTRATVVPRGRAVSILTIPDNLTIADLNVKVNLTHPRLSDLVIHLQSPTGIDILLFNRMGGQTANLVNTVFDDQASQSIVLGRAPFTGSFQPAIPLANLNSQNAKGTWKLWVEDRGGRSTGTLTSWSLIVRPKA